MISLAVMILICVAVILCGAVEPKPVGWVILALGIITLLLTVLGGWPVLTPPHK